MSGERLEAHTVVEREVNGERKSFWTRIGVAFAGKQGSKVVYSLQLDALPTNGKIVLMYPQEREQGGGGRSGTRPSREPGDDSW